jgi:hypothetical protein
MTANALQTTNYTTAKVMEGVNLNPPNIQLNALLQQYTSTATAASTTILTNATTFQQWFTGSTTQIVQLPNAETLYVDYQVWIVNNATGILTIKLNDTSTTLTTANPGDVLLLNCSAIGTTNGTWEVGIINQGTITVVTDAAWTPADASGATLSFTSVTATYSQISNFINFAVTLTYPSTASTAAASISGLPIAIHQTQYFTGYSSIGVVIIASVTSETITLLDSQFTAIENVQLTGATITINGTYGS